VACPFFFPLEKLETENWLHAPRVPLGDLYQGECRAQAPLPPATLASTDYCNNGYGRGHCEYFPAKADADAFRFHLIADHGDRLEIQYILEKKCWPIEHGVLNIASDEPRAEDTLRQQAVSFAASYRRRSQSKTMHPAQICKP